MHSSASLFNRSVMAFIVFFKRLIGEEGLTVPFTYLSWLQVMRCSSLPARTEDATSTACTTQSGHTIFSGLVLDEDDGSGIDKRGGDSAP